MTSQLGTVNNIIQVKKTDFEVFDALMVDSQKCSDVSGAISVKIFFFFLPPGAQTDCVVPELSGFSRLFQAHCCNPVLGTSQPSCWSFPLPGHSAWPQRARIRLGAAGLISCSQRLQGVREEPAHCPRECLKSCSLAGLTRHHGDLGACWGGMLAPCQEPCWGESCVQQQEEAPQSLAPGPVPSPRRSALLAAGE